MRSGLVFLGGNCAHPLKSPNFPWYFSRSLSQEAHDHNKGFLANKASSSVFSSFSPKTAWNS